MTLNPRAQQTCAAIDSLQVVRRSAGTSLSSPNATAWPGASTSSFEATCASDGRELLRRIAQRAFDAYLAHPWMLHAFGRRPAPGPNQLRRAEQSATAARALGIGAANAWTAVSIVHEWTMGHALHTVTLREDAALDEHLQAADETDYPNAAQALQPALNRGTQAGFAEALDTVLDEIEQRFAPKP